MPNTPLTNQYGQTFWTAEDFANLTVNPNVAAVLLGAQFSNTAPTFSFVTGESVFRPGYGPEAVDFTPLDNPLPGGAAPDPDGDPDAPPVPPTPSPIIPPFEKAAYVKAFQGWNDYTNLTLTQTSDTDSNVGNIRIGKAASGQHVFGPDEYGPEASDIWLAENFHPNLTAPLTDAQYLTILRTTGLSLGLKNPLTASAFNEQTLDAAHNSQGWTMFSNVQNGGNPIQTPGFLDILAMQTQFGAGAFNAGNNAYTTTPGTKVLYDTGGLDQLTLAAAGTLDLRGVDIDQGGNAGLHASTYAGSFTILGPNTNIENGVGSLGADTIWGSEGANRLQGRAGNDTINAGGGNDQIYGQIGLDRITTGNGLDNVFFNVLPTAGNVDTITDFRSQTDSLSFENAIFTGLSAPRAGGRIAVNDFYFDSVGPVGAHDLTDRIIVGANGNVFYDADGTGPTAQVLVARLSGTPILNASDVFVV